MSNTNRGDVVTLLWTIENFNDLFEHKLESPLYFSHSLDRTRWKMCLYPKGCDGDADDISLSLTRCGSFKQEVHKLVLDCELSIIEEYGENTLVSKQIKNHGFVKNHTWSPCKAFVSRYDVFTERRSDFIPYNVLHVRCRLWRSFNKSTLEELLISNSKVERSLFVWKIDNFSCLKDNDVKEIHISQSATETPILSFKFLTNKNSDAAIIEVASDKSLNIGIWCEIIVMDGTAKKFRSECKKFSSNDANPYKFSTFIKLSELFDNKTLYLPMDVLSLRVDCFFWSSKINIMDRPIKIPNLQICEGISSAENNDSQGKAENVVPIETLDKQSMTENISTGQRCDKQSMTENISTAQKCDKQSMTESENTKMYLHKPEKSCDREKFDVNSDTNQNLEIFAQDQDIRGMYEECLLSDFTLYAGNKTFPVHKSLLSARSPVFKTMITTPLKEKDGKTLDIPDIDADTLQRMLLFVYSSETGDLKWEDAIILYFAADKYNIEDLKSITSSVLKSKLSVSNVCEILVHADFHEDRDLKCSAMEFIANHDDEILGDENWETFQKRHMPLTMEIFSVLYKNMKKRLE